MYNCKSKSATSNRAKTNIDWQLLWKLELASNIFFMQIQKIEIENNANVEIQERCYFFT